MIKVIDLRVGNWLYKGEKGNKIIVSTWDLQNIATGSDEYIGITITEDFLLRVGFEKVNHVSGHTFYSHKKFKLSVYLDRKTIEWMGYTTACKLEVHALQNLIYALAGTEL